MIFVNQQIEAGKSYNSKSEVFPHLFYTDFNGKTTQIKNIDIRFCENGIDVQTDCNNAEYITSETKKWVEVQQKKLTELLADTQSKLAILEDISI